MEQLLVDAFAKEQGYDKAIYLCEWNGYKCYEPTFFEEGISFIGLPLLILEDIEGNLRMSSEKEAMRQIDETT